MTLLARSSPELAGVESRRRRNHPGRLALRPLDISRTNNAGAPKLNLASSSWLSFGPVHPSVWWARPSDRKERTVGVYGFNGASVSGR